MFAAVEESSFAASAFVIVVAKSGSFASAAANSAKVSRVAGAAPINRRIIAATCAVVASFVLSSSISVVGAVGVPVKAGLASGA